MIWACDAPLLPPLRCHTPTLNGRLSVLWLLGGEVVLFFAACGGMRTNSTLSASSKRLSTSNKLSIKKRPPPTSLKLRSGQNNQITCYAA